MYCYKLTRRIGTPGGVPQGFELQVTSSLGIVPSLKDLEAALKRAGFSDRAIHNGSSLQLSQWIVERK